MKKIKLGIPKGSLQEATVALFARAGFRIAAGERSYRPSIDDREIECVLMRAQEIPKYVERGVLDAGLTGRDWILETGAKVEELADLPYAKRGAGILRLVIAAPEASRIRRAEDLRGKRIATELVELTRAYLKRHKVRAEVEFSWGATEAKVPELADAIAELTETGSSLKANGLRIVDTVLEVTTKFIANKSALRDGWKRRKLAELALLLRGALAGERSVGIKMNVRKKNAGKVAELLPALNAPTISELAMPGWVALEAVIDEAAVRDIIPKLKHAGAEGIVEYPLNKIIE